MGEGFDAARYRLALEASQLVPDLEILPDGDATEIGDRGVTLSGRQFTGAPAPAPAPAELLGSQQLGR